MSGIIIQRCHRLTDLQLCFRVDLQIPLRDSRWSISTHGRLEEGPDPASTWRNSHVGSHQSSQSLWIIRVSVVNRGRCTESLHQSSTKHHGLGGIARPGRGSWQWSQRIPDTLACRLLVAAVGASATTHASAIDRPCRIVDWVVSSLVPRGVM